MGQDGRFFDEQYLLQVAADLLNRKSEIEQLREAVQLAEVERCTSLGRRLSIAALSPARDRYESF